MSSSGMFVNKEPTSGLAICKFGSCVKTSTKWSVLMTLFSLFVSNGVKNGIGNFPSSLVGVRDCYRIGRKVGTSFLVFYCTFVNKLKILGFDTQ